MGFKDKWGNGASLTRMLVERPGQARHLSRWWHELRTPTVDSGLPWLPFDLVEDLSTIVTRSTRIFEYGGGGSTLWFGQRAGHVDTVEHDPAWVEVLRAKVGSLSNVRIAYVDDPSSEDYFDAVSKSGAMYDIVVVDGRQRVRCFERAIQRIAPGGLLILDDSDRLKYAATKQLAAAWPATVYRGFAAFKPVPACSTVWRNPINPQ